MDMDLVLWTHVGLRLEALADVPGGWELGLGRWCVDEQFVVIAHRSFLRLRTALTSSTLAAALAQQFAVLALSRGLVLAYLLLVLLDRNVDRRTMRCLYEQEQVLLRFLPGLAVCWLPRLGHRPLLENVNEVLLGYVSVFLVLLLIFELLSKFLDASNQRIQVLVLLLDVGQAHALHAELAFYALDLLFQLTVEGDEVALLLQEPLGF